MKYWKISILALSLTALCAALAAAPSAPSALAGPEACLGGTFGDDDVNRACVFGSAMLLGALLAASGGTAGLLATVIAPKAAALCVAAAAL